MKKVLVLLLACCMVLSLSACGKKAEEESSEVTEVSSEVTGEASDGKDISEEEETVSARPVVDYIDTYLYPGDEMPNFEVTLPDGTVFNLDEQLQTHKAVMINIWATWCGPCRAEMPYMQEAWEMYKDELGLICLSPDDENDAIVDFQKENGLEGLPLAYDTVGLSDALVQEGYPTTIIVDRFGVYAFYECGSLTGTEPFARMWDLYLGDNYTESLILDAIPGDIYDGEYPTDEELTLALCQDGSVTVCYDHEDPQLWPFVVTEGGVINSNALKQNTYANFNAACEGKAGDVFAFDFAADLEIVYDSLEIYVNGELDRGIYYSGEGTYCYELPEDGSYVFYVLYNQNAGADETYSEGTVAICSMGLFTGDEAAEILASRPVYPFALEGDDFSIEVLNESAKEVRIVLPEGTDRQTVQSYANSRFYIIPEDFGCFRMLIGDEYDPSYAYAYGDYDYEAIVFAGCEYDEKGYLLTTELSSVEAGSYPDTYITLVPDMFDDYRGETIYIFKSEENLNYYCASEVYGSGYAPLEGVTWTYADGTLPSTDAIAEIAYDHMYNIMVVDENGDPVEEDIMINICTDESCTPVQALGGYYGFDAEPYPYIIHVLTVPEGYTFDLTTEFIMPEEGGRILIILNHA